MYGPGVPGAPMNPDETGRLLEMVKEGLRRLAESEPMSAPLFTEGRRKVLLQLALTSMAHKATADTLSHEEALSAAFP